MIIINTYPKFNPLDLIDKRFGTLVVKEFVEKIPYKDKYKGYRYYYKCLCDCGEIKIISREHLLSEHTKSCGIRKNHLSEYSKLTHTRLYKIWTSMHARCECKKHPSYNSYKNKLICQEWHRVKGVNPQQGFLNFYNWAMSHGYKDDLTLDRIDGTRGYNPENCRWLTIKEQSHNLKSNINIEYKSEIHCLTYWCEILNISLQAVNHCKARYKLSYPEIFDRYTTQHFDVKLQAWVKNDTGEIVLRAKKAKNRCGSNMHSPEEESIYKKLCKNLKMLSEINMMINYIHSLVIFISQK